MHFRKIQNLRGPNVWAGYAVLEGWLDLEALKDSPSDELPGFNERLMAWLPSLVEHRCSVGERGGFFQRLRRGTWQGHIIEHVALEMQTLAGTDVGFGRTRGTHEEGVYKVAVEYENEELGRASMHAALRICLAAVHDTPLDVQQEIDKLRELAARVLPSATREALRKAARSRRIPWLPMGTGGLTRLGYGHRQRRLLGTQTDRTSVAADATARDRALTLAVLASSGLPVPSFEVVTSAEAAWEEAEALGAPVVVRPAAGVGRADTFRFLKTREEVEHAYHRAAAKCGPVLVEKQLCGPAWRLLVVGEKVAAAALVGPASLADGTPPGADVTERLHPDFAAQAAEAARLLGLDVAGVDLVADDVRRPADGQHAAVTGVHPRPGLRVHLRPTAGTAQPVAESVVGRLYPQGENGRIPVCAVTGVNGKTTTTRLIAHVNARNHKCVGFTCTEGVYLEGKRTESGDCSGPTSARAVLANPKVEVAVLETARGGILRSGLGFDRCDVAVVTNIGEGDHLGLNDIHTPEELARVKRVIVEAVTRDGSAVLNAADPLVAEMAEHCRGDVVFFARDPRHPVLEAHRARDGRTAYVRDDHIVLAEGDQEIPLVSLNAVPLTHRGIVGFQVENCLAAAAACWSLGVPCQVIRVGLETFQNDLTKTPGRFNVFSVHGATVVLDYGHNAYALASLIEAMAQMPCQNRRVAVYSTAGDRRDCDLVRQGELLGKHFDRVILYEDHYLRGRQPGEIIARFREGVESACRACAVEEVQGAVPAMEHALATLMPGDLLLMQADVVDESVEFVRKYLAANLETHPVLQVAPVPAAVLR